MQRVDLELSDFSRRSGSVLIAHSATDLDRGLEPGERLLVRDGDGQHLVATVRDISFDLTDTLYRLELGAAVSAVEVDLILAEGAGAAAADVDLGDVLALLRQARSLVAERRYLAGALPR